MISVSENIPWTFCDIWTVLMWWSARTDEEMMLEDARLFYSELHDRSLIGQWVNSWKSSAELLLPVACPPSFRTADHSH